MLASGTPSAGAAALQSPQTQALSSPKVVAFYYTWFDESSWNHTLSDQPTQGYISRDRGVMGRHIEQAQQAGIDAFIVAWYGPTGQHNQTEPNLAALLEEAAARNFKIGILFETDSPFFAGIGDVTTAMSHGISVHASHPAYLRADDGRPVFFFWRTEAYSVAAWGDVRSQVDPGHSSVWIADGVNTSYLATFEGHHLYSNTWNPPTDLTYTNQKFANLVSQASSQYGTAKSWVATVMPGYNDVGIRGGGGFARGRDGGAYFDTSWQAAIQSQPSWIVINSFNEWPEGTYIEPSAAFGDLFLQKTAHWSQQYKQGNANISPPVVEAPPAAAPDATVTQSAVVQSVVPQSYVETASTEGPSVGVGLLNVRSSPGTESQVLTMLSQGTPVAIIEEQNEWVHIEADGQRGWVFAAMINGLGSENLTTTASALESVQSDPQETSDVLVIGELARREDYPRFIPYSGPQLGEEVIVDVVILNLRSGPGTDTAIIDELAYGEELIVEDTSPTNPEWIQVRSSGDNTSTGWVYSSMVK